MADVTRRVATEWRAFFSTEAARDGLEWILSQRPKVIGDTMESAALSGKESAGFDRFKQCIDDILATESARRSKSDEPDDLQ